MAYTRINEVIKTSLNTQIKFELESAYLYLNMSIWSDNNGYQGGKKFFFDRYKEELAHAYKIITYLSTKGCMADVETIDKQSIEFESLFDTVGQAYGHEIKITEDWNRIYKLAITEDDTPTLEFARTFVSEQIEEEEMFSTLVDQCMVLKSSIDTALSSIELDKILNKG